MTEITFVDGNALRAVDVNNALMHQAVIITTSGAKGSTWLGKRIYCTDIDMVLYWDGAVWRSEPKGMVGKGNSTGTGTSLTVIDSGYGDALINGSLQTVSGLVVGERYQIHAEFLVATTVDNQVINLKFYRDATFMGQRSHLVHKSGSSSFDNTVTYADEFGVTATSHDFQFKINVGIGAGFIGVDNGGGWFMNHVGQG